MKTGMALTNHPFRVKVKGALEIIKDYFLVPAWGGLLGFTLFFMILTMLKIFSYIMGNQTDLTIDLTDLLISFIGFVLLFSVRILEKFQK